MKETMQKDRLKYLDGLRAILVLVVVLEHFIKFVSPQTHSLLATAQKYNGVDATIHMTPFNVLHNGAWAVATFFVLSGYIVTYLFNQAPTAKNSILIFINRYVKFVLVIGASYILVYGITNFSLDYSTHLLGDHRFSSSVLSDGNVTNLLTLLKYSFIDVPFLYAFHHNPVLWTMAHEIYGSLFVLMLLNIFAALNVQNKPVIKYLMILTFLWFLITNEGISLLIKISIILFLFGMFLHDFRGMAKGKVKWILAPLLSLFALLMIGVDVRGSLGNDYSLIPLKPNQFEMRYFFNGVGGMVLLYLLLNLKTLQSILSQRYLVWLGSISFSLYATHYLVMGSLLSYLLTQIPLQEVNLYLYLLVPFTLAVMLIVAWGCSAFIENKVYSYIKLPNIGSNKDNSKNLQANIYLPK